MARTEQCKWSHSTKLSILFLGRPELIRCEVDTTKSYGRENVWKILGKECENQSTVLGAHWSSRLSKNISQLQPDICLHYNFFLSACMFWWILYECLIFVFAFIEENCFTKVLIYIFPIIIDLLYIYKY